MTVFPDARVYTAFDDGPYTASPTAWTEITSYVRSITTHRGRSSDLDQFDTGTAQLVLDNRARTFDPFYSIAATRTNLVPNPSFEVDTTNWVVGTNLTIARSTAQFLFGAASLSCTVGSTANASVRNNNMSITGGRVYVGSAYLRGSAARNAQILIEWRTAADVFISYSVQTTSAMSTTAWTRYSFSATAPANAAFARIVFQFPNAQAADVFYLDGAMFEDGSLGTYFDGGLDPYAYGTATTIGWTGTANNSASTLINSADRVNIITNPSFEINTTGWSSNRCAIARITTEQFVGAASLQLTVNAGETFCSAFVNPRAVVSNGLTYRWSFYAKQISGASSARATINWYTSGGTYISQSLGTTTALSSTWTRLNVSGTAPTNADRAELIIEIPITAAGRTIAADGCLFERATNLGDYFDGSTNSTGTLGVGQSSWTGTANGSTSQMLQFPRSTQLTPRRQIKITGTANSVEYDVFRGYVAGWPVTWSEAGKDSTVTIQCFDALGLMANEVVPTDWAQFYTLALNPRRYYRCNDSRNAGKITDQNNTTTPMNLDVFGTPGFIFETPPMADGLSGNSLYTQVDNNLTGIPTNTSEPNLTVCAFVNIITGSTGSTTYGPFTSYTFGRTFVEFRYNSGGTNGFWITLMNAGTTGRRYTLAAPPIGTPFHLAVVVTSNSGGIPSAVIYQNGLQVSPTSTTPVVSGGSPQESMRIDQFQLSEFAVFTSQLTAAQVAQIYNACTVRFSESTSARMQRLLDTTDWPAALESFPASPVGTVAEIGSGTGVVPELQLVADSEGGELYVSKTGVLTMTARRDVFNATRSATSQATFTDFGVGIRYGTELNIEYDADNLKNDITVNYSGDGEVNLYSDAVITGYGAASTTIETQLDSPTSALDLATLELGVEGVLIPQISPIDVSANTAAADWQTILGLELLDRVTFKRTPTVGNQFDRAALINAIDHQIEPGVWRTQVTLSMRYTSPLVLNDPVRGRLDYNYLG